MAITATPPGTQESWPSTNNWSAQGPTRDQQGSGGQGQTLIISQHLRPGSTAFPCSLQVPCTEVPDFPVSVPSDWRLVLGIQVRLQQRFSVLQVNRVGKETNPLKHQLCNFLPEKDQTLLCNMSSAGSFQKAQAEY